MFKVLLVLLVIFGAVSSIPALRNRVVPPLSKALGPTGEKIVTPVRKWKAKTGCTNLLRELSQAANSNKEVPEPGEFTRWAGKATNNKEGGIDPWGKRYYMRPSRGLMTVGSPGPDGVRDTADDIRATVPWDG